MAFEKGNKAAVGHRPRLFQQALNRAIAQDDGKRIRAAAEHLLDLAAQGEMWAVKELADRLDGKSVSTVDVNHARNPSELSTGELLALVSAERAAESQTSTGEPDSVH